MDERIIKFIKKHHVLTLATMGESGPYCANAFYAYDAERNLFIFTSSMDTLHAEHMSANPMVAASIVWETKLVGRIQGLQITARAELADERARSTYIKKFPYTAVAPLSLWALQPQTLKYTDNTLGFGKKILWNAE